MIDNRIGVVLAKINGVEKVQVIDGTRTADRPALIGYFILDIMREHYHKHKVLPDITLRVGTIEASQLNVRKRQGYDVRTSAVSGGCPGDILGEIYKTVLAVERGDSGLLNS